MNSIRTRIVLSLTLLIIGVGSINGVWVYRDSLHEAEEVFDAQLASYARTLHGLIDIGTLNLEQSGPITIDSWRGERTNEGPATRDGHYYERKIAFQVWSQSGGLLIHSANAPEAPLATMERGFSYRMSQSALWRTFTLFDEAHRRWYQVGESSEVRQELARYIARDTLLPTFIGIPLLMLLVFVVVSRGMRPLGVLSKALGAKDDFDLKPLSMVNMPHELMPLVDSLNTLLDRLGSALERERTFSSDAAHELRNSLAALQIHAQNTMTARDENERRESLQKMMVGLARTTHTVNQLLLLSRLSPDAPLPDAEVVAMGALIESVVGDYRDKAQKNDVELVLWLSDPIQLEADRILLDVLLRNLLENALRFAPPASSVTIGCEASEQFVTLSVTDHGPGIPAENRSRVLQRFQRGDANDKTGTGLGLSIVNRIAQRHGAQLTLSESDGGGLCAVVQFPQ